MTETTSERKPPPSEGFLLYAVAGGLLLVLLVAAILTPDYLNYRLRMAAIEAGKVSTIPAIATPGTPITAPGNPTTLPGNPGTAPVNAGTVKSSPTTSGVTPQELKSSEIFEAYGRLLTMLLALGSVLGVFFGYFVRKSLREMEEDLRTHVIQNMDSWEKQRDRLSSDVTAKLAEVSLAQKAQELLQKKAEKTLRRVRHALRVLDEAAKVDSQKATPNQERTAASVAATLDADDTIPNPGGA
jgi:hypothetical protein